MALACKQTIDLLSIDLRGLIKAKTGICLCLSAHVYRVIENPNQDNPNQGNVLTVRKCPNKDRFRSTVNFYHSCSFQPFQVQQNVAFPSVHSCLLQLRSASVAAM